jgi:hypothetical protein
VRMAGQASAVHQQKSPPGDCLGGFMVGHHPRHHGRIELITLAFAYLSRGGAKLGRRQSNELCLHIEGS